ncbi:hypothetical protein H4Q26_012423 [Puccinia striiformis f. sp. tritici PST-130]|nr:hypothetical protein H4Q26_012423 [Puccinia striiformis f. sp. tritici PST-130]
MSAVANTAGGGRFQGNYDDPNGERIFVAGSVELYTNRCIMAILGLKPQLLAWPNAEERSEVSSGFADGFEGCVGLIDGTLVVLSTCPGRDGPDYYNRKGRTVSPPYWCVIKRKISLMFTQDGLAAPMINA